MRLLDRERISSNTGENQNFIVEQTNAFPKDITHKCLSKRQHEAIPLEDEQKYDSKMVKQDSKNTWGQQTSDDI